MRSKRSRWGALGLRAASALALACAAAEALAQEQAPAEQSAAALAAEKSFLDENAAAMDKMMSGMEAKPTGDVDRDFVDMMAPHHQGAIDMAQTYLRHGRNEQLRRLAQEIIVEQQQEIAAMSLAVGAPLPPSASAATGMAPQPDTGSAGAPSARGHDHSPHR